MIRRTLAALILAALGLLVGLSLAPDALAWSPANLPPGWSTDHLIAVNAPSCPSAYRIRTATAGVFSDPLCEDSPTYQADFDAYVDAHYTAPAPTTTAASTTTPDTTTAPATTDVTTTAPGATTTTDPVTTQPAPAPPTSTDTTPTVPTVTVAATDPVIANLQAEIDALHAELNQLVCLLQTSKTLDPGILAALMSMEACS